MSAPRAAATKTKIGFIVGSTRPSSNASGIAKRTHALLQAQFPNLDIEYIDLKHSTHAGHPLPLEINVVPKALPLAQLPDAHTDPNVRLWSKTVLGWKGIIILTPQYNWSIPAPLKNALDQLYHEFGGKPVSVISYGGHGGDKVQAALKVVLEGAMAMDVGDRAVQIALPFKYIMTAERVQPEDDWLKEYDEKIVDSVKDLVKAVEGAAAA
jgi:NAD(P)H-dependent FMN reductase